MNRISLIRWFLLFTVGLPVQLAMYCLYPIAHLLWLIFIYKKVKTQLLPPHVEGDIRAIKPPRNGGYFLDNPDNHGAFTMYGFLNKTYLSALVDGEGNFARRTNEDWTFDMKAVSGDVVASWTFATIFTIPPMDTVKLAIDNYVKYLGSRSFDGENKGWVSNKCNNLGLNYCPDGWCGMGQPTAGPQFYTTSSLLALGYKLGFKYKLYFWVHWIVFGGWFWAFSPVIYTKDKPLFYARDISMKALYVHLEVFGPRWWIKLPMKYLINISEYRNDLFVAMTGRKPISTFPEYTSPFFSQRANCAATPDSSSNSQYMKAALNWLAIYTRFNEK